MKRLGFHGRWIGPVRDGRKTTTIRKPSPRLPAVDELFGLTCRYDRPPFARAVVSSVREVTTDELTEADALADGFRSLAELRAELASLAPKEPALFPRSWVVISFDLAP